MLQPYGAIHDGSKSHDLFFEVNRKYNIGVRENICKCGQCRIDYNGQRRAKQDRKQTGVINKMRALKKKERNYGKKIILEQLEEHIYSMVSTETLHPEYFKQAS